eukprot:gene4970-biopygen164
MVNHLGNVTMVKFRASKEHALLAHGNALYVYVYSVCVRPRRIGSRRRTFAPRTARRTRREGRRRSGGRTLPATRRTRRCRECHGTHMHVMQWCHGTHTHVVQGTFSRVAPSTQRTLPTPHDRSHRCAHYVHGNTHRSLNNTGQSAGAARN